MRMFTIVRNGKVVHRAGRGILSSNSALILEISKGPLGGEEA